MRWKENDKKFKELVLYISARCANQPTFGAVKLNKIMYYSDFLAYARLGKPITGHPYQKLRNGPAPRKLPIIRDSMIKKERSLGIQPVRLESGHIQERPVNLRDADLTVFSADEIELVNFIIESLTDADAETISRFSHSMLGWIIAKEGEIIPYSTVFLSNEPLTEIEIQRGRGIAAKYGAWA